MFQNPSFTEFCIYIYYLFGWNMLTFIIFDHTLHLEIVFPKESLFFSFFQSNTILGFQNS